MTEPPWARARSLAERGAAARGDRADPARAERWAQALPAAALDARVRDAALAPGALAAALGDGDDAGPPPEWWAFLEEVLAPGSVSPVGPRDDAADALVDRGTVRLVAPFVRWAHRRIAEHPAATPVTSRSLAGALAAELVELARPAVVLELVATGARDEPAVAAALRALGSAERARELLGEHAALARLVVTRTRLAVAAGHELLGRLAAELPAVGPVLLSEGDPGAITAIDLAGDPHAGGRRVARVTFASGARVVAKARSVATDVAFAGLLDALNALGFAPAFAPPATVATGPGHGWQAWAQPGPCSTRAEVDRYFRRLGGQLAVLHALRATDIHQENVLACGEHPALIDLETVLHPRLGGARAAAVDPLISENGLDCVLRVGLLPRADAAFGADISGLGRDPGLAASVAEPSWSGAGADAWSHQRTVTLTPGDNAARLGEAAVRPADHLDALATGFAAAYDLLVAHRDALLAPGGALTAFAGARVRLVLRPTKVYVDLGRQLSLDLDALGDGRAREERLNVLWRGGVRRPELATTARWERHDLWEGDVPQFTAAVGSSDGHHHAAGPLPGLLGPHRVPGPEVVRRLDGADRDRQLGFVRASVLAAAAAMDDDPGQHAGGREDAVADRLAVLALVDGDQASWLAPTVRPPAAGRVLRPVGPGLVDGQAGIALFMTRAGAPCAPAAARRLEHLLEGPDVTAADRAGAAFALGAGPVPADAPPLLRLLALPPGAQRAAVAAALPPSVATVLALAAVGDGARASERALVLGADVEAGARLRAVAAAARARPGDGELAAALTAALEADPEPPAHTTARLDHACALADAAAVLGWGRLRTAAAEAADAVAAAPWRFPGHAETPVLCGGLAGVGLRWLALAGDAHARGVLAVA